MLSESAKRKIYQLPAPAHERAARIVREVDVQRTSVENMLDRRHVLMSLIEKGEISLADKSKERGITEGILKMDRELLGIQRKELAEIDAFVAERAPRSAGLRRLLDEIVALASTVPPGKALKPARGPEASPRKGEDLKAAFDRCESGIAALNAEADQIANAPITASAAKALARRQIEQLAERGRPDVSALIAHGEHEIIFSEVQMPLENGNPSGAPAMVVDSVGLFCWLNRDAMVAAIDKQIAAEADDKNAIDPAEKKAAIEKIKTQIAALERDAAQFFYLSIEAGIAIVPLENTDIRALLGLDRGYLDVPVEPYKRISRERPAVSAPVHPPVHPEPAMRDEIWR